MDMSKMNTQQKCTRIAKIKGKTSGNETVWDGETVNKSVGSRGRRRLGRDFFLAPSVLTLVDFLTSYSYAVERQ